MKKTQKIKRQLKIISIVIILTMLIGNIFGMGATMPLDENVRESGGTFTAFTPNDPLEFMKDIPVEIREIPDDFGEQPYDELYVPEIDDGSTDRYIVKYKSFNGKQNFQSKLSSQIAYSEEICASVDRARTAESRTSSENPSGNGDKSTLRTNQWEVLTLNEKILPSELAEAIRSRDALGDIEYIQPDYKLLLDSVDITGGKLTETNGDVLIDRKLGTPTDIYNRNAEVIVAVIDTGIDIYHDDLADYVDAANMWDFANNTSEIYSPSNPLESAHGTHIAGIIANTARENGVDNIKILPLKVFSNGFAYTSDIMAAIEYALEHGAAIVNCSFGSTQENPALAEIIANANALFVCAVGNNRRDFMETPSYPAGYDLHNVISVASVNADGGFSYFSNYGENIDITALGRDVWSTLPENEYGMLTGTSMSAGYVTAVAAIVSANESLSAGELRHRLIDTADMLSNLQGKVNQGRCVNLANAVNNIVQTDVIENYPEDDFDVHGYQMTESELFQLYSLPSITANTDFIVMCSLDNIISFNGKTFKITYNPAQVQLIDFAVQTPELNVSVGLVPDTDLEILSHDTLMGVLTFAMNKTIAPNKMWSGVVTILKFNALVTDITTVTFAIVKPPQTKPIKPENLQANVTATSVAFTWIDPNPAGVIDYTELTINIPGSGWTNVPLQIENGVEYTFTYLRIDDKPNGDYDFRIQAVNNDATTPKSAYAYNVNNVGDRVKVNIIITIVKPPQTKPIKPENLNAEVTVTGVTFTWDDPNPAGAIDYTELTINIPGSGWTNVPLQIENGVEYTFTYLRIDDKPSGDYDFRIQVVNNDATTPKSAYAYLVDNTNTRKTIYILIL